MNRRLPFRWAWGLLTAAWFGLTAWCPASNACEEVRLRVAISPGWGAEQLAGFFDEQPAVAAELLHRLHPGSLEGYDVLVITQRSSAVAINRMAAAIRQWVERGHGVLVLHGAAGYGTHLSLFPEVAAGAAYRPPAAEFFKKPHPVMAGWSREDLRALSDSEIGFIGLALGAAGEPLLGDGQESVAVAAGQPGRGRVLYYGLDAAAVAERFDAELRTAPEELAAFTLPGSGGRRLLLEALLWLGTP